MSRVLLKMLLSSLMMTLLLVACTPEQDELQVTRPPSLTTPVEATDTTEPTPPSPEATDTSEPYPPPTSDPTDFILTQEALETLAAGTPTATNPPLPTPIPTPVVTPIPTAVPPIIPLPEGQTPQPFTILYRQGDVLWAIDSDSTEPYILLDVQSALGLHFLEENLVWNNGWASPSPDGEQLALVLSTMAEQPNRTAPLETFIYLFHRHTGELNLLVEAGLLPVWSPDGSQLAYRQATSGGLWVVEVASGQAQELYAVSQDEGEPHYVAQMSWSPDSQHLVFLDISPFVSRDIVVVDVNQAQPPHVVLSPENYSVAFPQWSPDGSQILFASPADENTGFSETVNLWMMSLDGIQQNQLTQHISVDTGGVPQGSPDGTWIVFSGTRYFEELEPLVDLWLVAKDGTSLHRLTSDSAEQINETRPIWSPDGTRLVFYKELNELWLISLVDGTQTRIPVPAIGFAELIALP